jgi:hypothetical protein
MARLAPGDHAGPCAPARQLDQPGVLGDFGVGSFVRAVRGDRGHPCSFRGGDRDRGDLGGEAMPILNGTPQARQASRKWWERPPESARTVTSVTAGSTGIWARAASRTPTWSVAVPDTVLPARSNPASASPVESRKRPERTEPVAALVGGCRSPFVECEPIKVPSISRT